MAEAAVANREARFERHFLPFVASQGRRGKRESQSTSVKTARTNYSFFDVSIPCDFGGGHHPSTGVLSACGMHPPSLSVSFGSQRKERERERESDPHSARCDGSAKVKKSFRTIPPPSLGISPPWQDMHRCKIKSHFEMAKGSLWQSGKLALATPIPEYPFPFPPFPSFSAVPAFAW